MAKTNKSIVKRFKLTSTGKILKLGSGINHFQAKKPRSKQLAKKVAVDIKQVGKKMVKSYLYH